MHEKPLSSIIEAFYYWEKVTPDKVFLRQPEGDNWFTLTFAEAGQQARRMASYLGDCGLQRGDHVGLLSKNCYHWILADLAIMMGGYVSIPYYASLPKPQLKEVLELSDVKLVFVGKLDAWGDKNEAFPEAVKIIKFPHYSGNAEVDIGDDWNAVIDQHEPINTNLVPQPDDLWTIKFTSGTTGKSKGVMHVHGTPVRVLDDERSSNWVGLFKLPEIRCLSFLPLNHVAERMSVEVTAIYCGGSISFAQSLDTFAKNLRDTQPTVLFAVPRIWTKFQSSVTAKIPSKRLKLLLKLPLISGFIRAKLKEQMGLRDLRFAGTGAAITPAFVKDFFKQLDIHLIEAYGMTEVCGSVCSNPNPGAPNDCVGQAIPGGQIRVDPTTQEILMKTPYVMKGYYQNQAKTDEVLVDGWMHSGDRGSIDEHGFVRIIGRVNDVFKTAKGSFVTPNPMEERLNKNSFLEQVCVVGLGNPQPLALVNLSLQGANASVTHVTESLTESLQQLNATLAKFECLSTIVVCAEPWSEKNGLLTPTLKVKRSAVDDQFQSRYLQWHQAQETVVWM